MICELSYKRDVSISFQFPLKETSRIIYFLISFLFFLKICLVRKTFFPDCLKRCLLFLLYINIDPKWKCLVCGFQHLFCYFNFPGKTLLLKVHNLVFHQKNESWNIEMFHLRVRVFNATFNNFQLYCVGQFYLWRKPPTCHILFKKLLRRYMSWMVAFS